MFRPDIYVGDGFGFGTALDAVQAKFKLCRAGWIGKNMFIMLIDPYHNSQFAPYEKPGLVGTLAPYIAMKTSDNKLVPWAPSQTDLLAKDWRFYDDETNTGYVPKDACKLAVCSLQD